MDSELLFINCQRCTNKYDSPRGLPCGETVCLKCIQRHSNDVFYDCICKKSHYIPPEGFPINVHLKKIIETIESSLSRGTIFEEFKENLQKADDLINNFVSNFQLSKCKINEYFTNLINRIDLSTESKIKQLQDSREKLIKNIRSYEQECLDNFELQTDDFKYQLKSILECKDGLDEERKTLNSIFFEDEDLKDSIASIKEMINIIQTETKKYENLLFKNHAYDFVSGTNGCTVGEIVKIDLNEINRNDYEEIDLASHFQIEPSTLKITQLKNEKFVFTYLDDTQDLTIIRLESFDETKPTIFKTKYSHESTIGSHENKVLFYFRNDNDGDKNLMVLDENLEFQIGKGIDHDVSSIRGSDENILVLVLVNEDETKIVIHDWQLNELIVVNYHSSYFYHSNDIFNIYDNDEYFIFEEIDHLTFVKKGDSKFSKWLEFDKDVHNIFSNVILSHDDKENRVELFDFNGDLVESKNLKNFDSNCLCFFLNSNGKFFIVDTETFKFYKPVV